MLPQFLVGWLVTCAHGPHGVCALRLRLGPQGCWGSSGGSLRGQCWARGWCPEEMETVLPRDHILVSAHQNPLHPLSLRFSVLVGSWGAAVLGLFKGGTLPSAEGGWPEPGESVPSLGAHGKVLHRPRPSSCANPRKEPQGASAPSWAMVLSSRKCPSRDPRVPVQSLPTAQALSLRQEG